MLADAIRSETYRLSRNRTALFWSVLFVPIMGVLLATVGFVVAKANEAKLVGKLPPEVMKGGPLDLGLALVKSAGDFANPAILMFVLIGAVTLYAGDYRWETWRLISARNTRSNLIAGKVVVAVLVIVLATLAALASDVIAGLIQAAVFGRPLAFSMTGGAAADFGLLALTGWARILQFTMLGLLAAVMTRSLLAALFAPLVIGIGQFFLPNILLPMGVTPDGWLLPLLSPGLATDLLKAVIEGGTAADLPDHAAAKGLLGLGLWIGLPFAAAAAWFNRQDLSKE
ncbi:ABC transporter permease subunit [uncultured Brevundimonas sp.]|uniref:ABC transporter permease subunit n=1 Tax=uncultured Brevundimonas sp. TaxID=213418 RepID=UPI0025F4670C|nr:ABC transporter permease subunit [uncultured Brevundimonas sp.]